MSEYQYYEFLAVDRPLTDEDQQDLRAISSRARITRNSFTNHYRWGDLKAIPRLCLRNSTLFFGGLFKKARPMGRRGK